jgi:hypothetical protein
MLPGVATGWINIKKDKPLINQWIALRRDPQDTMVCPAPGPQVDHPTPDPTRKTSWKCQETG